MPVYYITSTVTGATTTTNSNWVWMTNGTTATTTTTPVYWNVPGNDDWSDDSTYYTPVRIMTPQHTLARPYIARRSPGQAAEDELRHYYEQEQRRQQNDIQRQHNQAARDRSRELLLAHLTPAQRETFAKNRWFIVEGGLSKQRYRIRDTGHMVANIDVLGVLTGDEKVSHRLCGHCDLNEVPLYDQLLAQKMMLEFDEELFLKVANRHRVMA